MKIKLLPIIAGAIFYLTPNLNSAQAPNLGTASEFVLFTTIGAVSNSGISQVTGNVGTNNGSSTGFGNVNGGMHDNDLVSAQCAVDLQLAYNQLDIAIPTNFPGILLGNGDTLNAGVHSVPGAATLSSDLYLDALGDASAVFIFQIEGALSTAVNSKIKLINGALACNVFWKVEGLVILASGTNMSGTLIANNSAISLNAGDTLNGRAFSISGAITLQDIFAYTPIGCGSPAHNGPIAPNLASTECYGIFSGDGPVTNGGITYVTGDIGTNVGLTTGFNALYVTGMIHPIPDVSTATCAADLLNVYTYLSTLPADIELLYPSQFGSNLVLTPHTYIMNSAVTLTDTLYLSAEGNANAVFVIQVFGAFATTNYSKVILTNGTQSKNVFWMINGAVDISDYSVFRGTIVCNNGAIDLATGVYLDGRAFTTSGALGTASITAVMPLGCSTMFAPVIIAEPVNQIACNGTSASFSVVATGTGLIYQWRNGTINLINGSNISGATTATLTINAVSVSDMSSGYNVVVTGSVSPNDTSAFVSLLVEESPDITSQPVSEIACVGDVVSFSVVATGSGLTYQWRNGIVDLVDGLNISGATTASLTINSMMITDTSSNYNVVITGNCLPESISNNVSLTDCALGIETIANTGEIISIYPNPFSNSTGVYVKIPSADLVYHLRIFNFLCEEVMYVALSKSFTSIDTGLLSSGVYFYNLIGNNKPLQSGKLIVQQ